MAVPFCLFDGSPIFLASCPQRGALQNFSQHHFVSERPVVNCSVVIIKAADWSAHKPYICRCSTRHLAKTGGTTAVTEITVVHRGYDGVHVFMPTCSLFFESFPRHLRIVRA